MARRVFFSFHYERDIWRASVVRNSWKMKPDREAAGFFDASIWEKAKTQGKAAIEKMIDEALVGTSVTAVLIGNQTASRGYVKYEIEQSVAQGKTTGTRTSAPGSRKPLGPQESNVSPCGGRDVRLLRHRTG
jgi:MTH538 TIR-like domain (DUF1863)